MKIRFYNICSVLTLGEMLLAPHYWATNYVVGFCDKWGVYLKAFVNQDERMLPIVSYINEVRRTDHGSTLFTANFCPSRAQYHIIDLLYELPAGKDYLEDRIFDDTEFRIRLMHGGRVFYSSKWDTMRRYIHVVTPGRDYANHPFGEQATYAEITLDSLDPSRYPWSYSDLIIVEVEFKRLDKRKFDEVHAMLCIRVYNVLEM